jgi:hypothetical protein
MSRTAPRELNAALRLAVAADVVPAARVLAPRRTGRLADSLRPYTSGNRAGVRSRLPYANPIHWGWPKHHIKASEFVLKAMAADGVATKLEHRVADGIIDTAKKSGFH